MRNVIFVAPFPLETTYMFVRAVAALKGVRLLGIVTKPPSGRDATLFHDLVSVSNPMSGRMLVDAAKLLQARHGKIDRVLGILEALQVHVAQIRAVLGVDGVSIDVADKFRDKGRMKDELRKHDLPCAKHAVVTCLADAEALVDEVGFPIVIKPTAGMACKATFRIENAEQLEQAVAAMGATPQQPAIAEEFIRGREFSFETITIDGEVKFTSFTRYYPAPIQVMENPWIQWSVVHPRSVEGPEFDDAKELGIRAVKSLGMSTGFTHMEWFRREDGSLAIGEIAARPPGAQIVVGNNYVHDADLHYAWARAVVDGEYDGPWERKYSVGAAFLRGMGRGVVMGVRGVAAANQKVGPLVVHSKLPRPGMPKSDSYEGDGYVILRHPDTEVVKEAVNTVISTIRVDYGGR